MGTERPRSEKIENKEKRNRHKEGKQRGDEGTRRRDAATAVGYKTNLPTLFIFLINSC